MKRKGATHLENLPYGVSSTSTYPHDGDYEGGTKKPKGSDYEVFLSYSGQDTGKGFTDYLYTSLVNAGVHVFRFDNELCVGDEIGPELLHSITQSMISIPIMSENYASSKWCLHELAQMLKCKRSRGQMVLPIFYKVEPSYVRHLRGRWGDAINAHRKNLDNLVTREWEEALREVCVLKGWESEKIDDGHEGTLIAIVVRKVLGELQRTLHQIVPEELVGIEDRVEEIMTYINAKLTDTTIIGIYGIGGIGKTTLAKVLYNKLSGHFEYRSFVADIRETSIRKGIEFPQKQLIYDILRSPWDVSNVNEGVGVIKSRFTNKKVLIVLDDIDANAHLNVLAGDSSWFKAGSVVIITTRNKSILDKARADYMCQLNELSLDQSLILFSRHAFKKDSPQSDYEVISRDIISTTAGLPLALESIGSSLYGKRKEVWKAKLKILKKVPTMEVQRTLMISYDALSYLQKQIFLDIACLFIGSSKQTPTYMWESCDLFPETVIEDLSQMSLIKIDKDGTLMMHDQLRDLGREIVHLENRREPQQRSRVWINEEAVDVLANNKGTSKIEALCLYGNESYTGEQFKELTNLRFLQMNGVDLVGDFQNLLPQLRWLQWKDCPTDFVAVNFHPKKLVVLNLSWTGISEDWGGWGLLKMTTKLKVINLKGCHSLERTPNLSSLESLEILILEECENLEEIHPSIGNIKTLVSLNVWRCRRLKELPARVGRMQELRELLLDHTAIKEIPISKGCLMKLETLRASCCRRLAQLPESIDCVVSLTHLDLSQTGIEELPISIGSLKQLDTLDASYCASLARIPYSIGYLASLSLLDLTQCDKLAQLPDSICSLVSLQRLLLRGCRSLREIPDSIGKLASLSELDLKFTAIVKLPESIGNLQNLRVLDICGTCITELPDAIGMLVKLQELRASHCKNLEELPSNIGELVSLNKLDLNKSGISGLPKGISNLSSLQNLSVQRCEKLRELPELSSEGLLELSSAKILLGTNAASSMRKSQPKTEPIEMQRDGSGPGILLPGESTEKIKDETRQRAAEMETLDRNYAIAAVQNLVGIDDHVKHITDLLEMEVSDEICIIGIYGTDGIGKTTLAKAVYNRISSCFDSRSFLAGVKETTQNPRGIQFLQTKLICDILELDHEDPSFDGRVEPFLDIFREMKVLIVVDDVQKKSHLHAFVGDHLNWFGLGSRIIVTSENKEILKEYDPGKARSYMVSQLDNGQAVELFRKHAFRMQSSKPEYDELANLIVGATVKLPLAVEVIGSFLWGKSIEVWEKMEKSMKQLMMSSRKTAVGCKEILDMCYKALDPKQKHIFLDVACFISGVDAQIASYMWPNSCIPSPDCILMPLAKIGENNKLQMHRLVRFLGKRILDQEESEEPIPRKFCLQDMVPKAISGEKGMENVEALCFDLDDHASCILTAGDFESMPDIRFLKLDNAKVSGDFARAFPSLRWLCWQRCPLDFGAINFLLRELVIFYLSWSKVTEDWGGWSEIKMEKLKVLNLTGCSNLLITPHFSGYKDLEILILERCSRLVKLDSSIGHLKRLVSLNLKFCSQLNGLPAELGCSTALKELFIDGTSVRQIPISIGNLKQLEILSGFKCFPLTHVPSSIIYLTALSELSLDGAKITELPSLLGELLNLRRLSLRDCCYVEELPDSIGKKGSLEELDISATSISKLPASIRNLQTLRVLRMDSSFIRAIPKEIGNLTKLEELHASWCQSLKGAIPGNIKRLHHLRSLTLGHSSISSLPPEISTISGLLTLDLIQCNEIEELPKLPPSLICLRVSSKRMKAIPLLEDLKELEELCLSDGDLKACRPPSKQPMPESNLKQMIDEPSFSISFPKLRKLELSLSRVIKLKFEPACIPKLETPTLPGLSLKKVSELPKMLSVFELYHSAIEEIEGLKRLKVLKRLDISNCKIHNLDGIGQLTSLRSLILSDCDDLSSLDLSNLKSLKVLEIRQCKMIHQIEGLEKLTSLKRLKISECPAENSEQVQNTLKDVRARSTVT